jgi:hypothetical protein
MGTAATTAAAVTDAGPAWVSAASGPARLAGRCAETRRALPRSTQRPRRWASPALSGDQEADQEPPQEADHNRRGRLTPPTQHIPERTAVGHGHELGEVTLGGRRVAVDRPRGRRADGRSEVRLRRYEYVGDRDLLSRAVLERMLAGVSTVATAGRRSRSARRWSSRRGRRRARRSRVPSLSAFAAHSVS